MFFILLVSVVYTRSFTVSQLFLRIGWKNHYPVDALSGLRTAGRTRISVSGCPIGYVEVRSISSPPADVHVSAAPIMKRFEQTSDHRKDLNKKIINCF
jgi:hypothetical protein